MVQLFSKLIMKATHEHSDANGRAVFGAIIYRNFAVKSFSKMKRLVRLTAHGGCALASSTAGLEWTLNTSHRSAVSWWAAMILREMYSIVGCYTLGNVIIESDNQHHHHHRHHSLSSLKHFYFANRYIDSDAISTFLSMLADLPAML